MAARGQEQQERIGDLSLKPRRYRMALEVVDRH